MQELDICEVERDFYKSLAEKAICENHWREEWPCCDKCVLKAGEYCDMVEKEINNYVYDEENGEMVSRDERDKRECLECWNVGNRCPRPNCQNHHFIEAAE